MITKETIRATLLDNRPLSQNIKALRIGLFGSHARGMATDKSDIDLLVETGSGMDLMSVVDLEMRLSDPFGKKVDLISVKGLNRHLKERVLSEAEFVEGI